MRNLTLFNAEYNSYNGFTLSVLNIEAGNFEGALFGLHFWSNFLIIEICFIKIEISKPF
jgi:hypothetical protein